ncbi:peroxisomal membrane protein 2 isoform X1 [Choloepus didactylus]|uniref:peroxisomal membrane protein 2 isoform X1 n=1 Tax=Choloepus didactylus TaxID=27675 RepID=UPI00189DC3D1|nr:peroxisomal membrane protein 2 isoform X1 [Choloepus didactylus]
MLTKAATSGILSALGNYLAQLIEKNRRKEKRSQNLDVIGPLRYAIYGFFCTGPLSHCFYLLVERWIPAEAPLAGVQRLLLERARFAPACLLLFFLSMDLLEGRSMAAFSTKMREGFWPALRTNWEVWTPVQFINLNYVPLQGPGHKSETQHIAALLTETEDTQLDPGGRRCSLQEPGVPTHSPLKAHSGPSPPTPCLVSAELVSAGCFLPTWCLLWYAYLASLRKGGWPGENARCTEQSGKYPPLASM